MFILQSLVLLTMTADSMLTSVMLYCHARRVWNGFSVSVSKVHVFGSKSVLFSFVKSFGSVWVVFGLFIYLHSITIKHHTIKHAYRTTRPHQQH